MVEIKDNIRTLVPLTPGRAIDDLLREANGRPVSKLASNENALGPGELALAAMSRALEMSHYYPDPKCSALRQRLAVGVGLSADHIIIGNGSEEVLTLAAMACAGVGDEVLTSEVTFPTYGVVTAKVGASLRRTPMAKWGHDLDALLTSAGPATAVVFIANPNNPTGTALSAGDFVQFMDRVSPRTLVVVDEAYFEYQDSRDAVNGAELVRRYDNLLVTRTFSKMYGLGGLRVGYGMAQPRLIEILNRARMPFSVNRLGLTAAHAALDDVAHLTASRSLNHSGKARLTELFTTLGFECLPAHGNFVTTLLPTSAERWADALATRGVFVRPLTTFGMPQAVRVTVGTPTQIDHLEMACRAEVDNLVRPTRRSTGGAGEPNHDTRSHVAEHNV